jgi:hypothetical protein
MSYKNLEQAEAAVAAAKYENAKRLTRIHVYQKYERVLPCDANDRRISDIIDRWTGNPDVLHSLFIFEEACAANPTEFNSLAKDTEKNICADLTNQIISMLAAHGKAHDEWSLKQERTRLTTFTIPMLRARLADLQRGAHMAGQSVQQLKQMVADARPALGFPALPKTMWDGAAGKHVTVDSAYLRSRDAWELKRLLRLYGEQVNQRLNS